MARRDYAKKNSGKAAASRATRKKPAPKKQPFPLVRVVLSLLFLAGFGYALFQLTNISPDPKAVQETATAAKPKPRQSQTKPVKQATPPAKAQPKTVTKAQTKQQPSGIPVEDNSERFEFYRMLPESQVDTANVDAYTSTPKDAKTQHRYVLQVGSFQRATDAEQMRARLILEGLPDVHTRKVTNSNGTKWHQVRVGPFDNRSRLNKAQDKLVRLNIQPLQKRVD
ncbi:MAG: SPOR domain-containing protein [Amphritea sp.]